jgi:hypothetical protein
MRGGRPRAEGGTLGYDGSGLRPESELMGGDFNKARGDGHDPGIIISLAGR